MLASLHQSARTYSIVGGLLQHFIHSQSAKPRRVAQQDKKVAWTWRPPPPPSPGPPGV